MNSYEVERAAAKRRVSWFRPEIPAPPPMPTKIEFPANPKNGDTFRWFDGDGWYKRISDNGLWERHEAPKTKPKFGEYRTHFYWLGSAAEVMLGEPKLPRGVRTEPYTPGRSYNSWESWMNLGEPVSWVK